MDIYASDEEKAEEIKRWWRENGKTVVASVLIGFMLIFAARYWVNYQQNKALHASLVYQEVLTNINEGKLDVASKHTEELLQRYSSSAYAVFAALQLASEIEDKNEQIRYLQWVESNAKLESHQELAKLRRVRLLISQSEFEQALGLISQSHSKAYQSMFSELQGDIFKAQGKYAEAQKAYQLSLSSSVIGGSRQSLLQMKIDDVAVSNDS